MNKEEMSSVLGHEPLTFEQMKELEQLHLQHDWESLRNQAAIAAMQGALANCYLHSISNNIPCSSIAKQSVLYADALIEELKKKRQ